MSVSCNFQKHLKPRGGVHGDQRRSLCPLSHSQRVPFCPTTQEPELKNGVFEVALQEAHLRIELEIHKDPGLRCQDPESRTFWIVHGYWRGFICMRAETYNSCCHRTFPGYLKLRPFIGHSSEKGELRPGEKKICRACSCMSTYSS